MFREVPMVEVREVLRLWLRGHGRRAIARLAQVDRKTVRRYLEAAERSGLVRSGGELQLTDQLLGALAEELRAGRHGGRGLAWEQLQRERGWLEEKLGQELQLTKIHSLLVRRGVSVPYRTLHRFCVQELGFGRQQHTVRVVDGEPGSELQVDFGRMGPLFDLGSQRRRLCWALIFTACYSRYMFCWLSFEQTLAAVIEGFEQAWAFFGGVFRVVIPDGMRTIVIESDPVAPRFNAAFLEYAQARGFVLDPARVRRPTDKPRVERCVSYCREGGFHGEAFTGLEEARLWMARWCLETAGERIHGTTQRRPRECFEQEEKPRLLPAPECFYELPLYAQPKVHRDFHIEVGRALYSVPHHLIGEHVHVRGDRHLVKVFHRGRLIKVHPRKPPGGRSTDPQDFPDEKRAYAFRDLEYLKRVAAGYGAGVGAYAEQLLNSPLPWTRMRQVYRLLGLVRRYGPERVEQACQRALDLDVIDVTRINRMLERALEASSGHAFEPGKLVQLRFARSSDEFLISKEVRPDE